ncbi:BCCT family transporter [Maledivibacter halophilus]|uniref:BCCT, betaine/carnitine/choline family transporter n=1 Tax=Maledivibacter halophilus TaxID=36842 RepID=A0A1T5KZJ3_9FIRM|nr:BCCT family transporter [Maledivibacter halophilus]SKC69252.1 BCCT, betaine/carnitine/choline family transporter [Maledivibacter halophilus]
MKGEKGNANVKRHNIRWEVFIPGYIVIGGAAILGIVNKDVLTKSVMDFFFWSLRNFGWLFQWTVMISFVFTAIMMFSKYGNIRLGGKNAKPKFKFATWFAMTLTGGVATGIVTWGVNEPLIYYGNVWGELDTLGIQANTSQAAIFAIARSFYNWTFIPYAIYAFCGLLVAYIYFNKRERLAVTSTLKPLFGEKVTKGWFSGIIDMLSMLGLAIGITTGLTMCITLVMTGLKEAYNVKNSLSLFIIIGIFIICMFTFSSYLGLEKGLAKLSSLNAWFYYFLLALLLITGPTIYIMRIGTAGLAEWLQNFFRWGLDPIDIGGEALTMSWTLYDWAFWVGFAPVTGIFLAMISYGRTIREYMIVNWILPSVFGMIWFSIWGGSAIHMQITGAVDLIQVINDGGAVAALWTFLGNLPFGIGKIIVPFNMLVILVTFITAADATLTNIGSMCVKDVPIGTEPPGLIKIVWGVALGVVAIVMAAFGGGVQGVDGVKALAAASGFVVLFIFAIQLVSFFKCWFMDRIITEPDEELPNERASEKKSDSDVANI